MLMDSHHYVDLAEHVDVEPMAPVERPVASEANLRLVGEPLQARHRGHVIASTVRGLALDCPGRLPIYFFPRADVRLELLGASPTMGLYDHCGVAAYFDVVVPGAIIIDGAISFAMPEPALAEITDYIGFDTNQPQGCTVAAG